MKLFWVLALVLVIVAAVVWGLLYRQQTVSDSDRVINHTWTGFKRFFVEHGCVARIKDGDTVSEGQAYAMLRAVWMDDKSTFNECYFWTEENLSRSKAYGDNLLAWHYKDGEVIDWMPASDADIDYALSLIFAQARWPGEHPAGLCPYGEKATLILSDILRLETFCTAGGRIYLSPWILSKVQVGEHYPINPSYYSPAHFRIFHRQSKDPRWLQLIDTTYYLLEALSNEFNGVQGVGLVPDWCGVGDDDKFYPFGGKNTGFGYEAIRVPFRVALDWFWFKDTRAWDFLSGDFSSFLENEFRANDAVFCEYDYGGRVQTKYENPAFYACYYYALAAAGSECAQVALRKTRNYIRKHEGVWVYQDQQDYYLNSIAWLADGLYSLVVVNLAE